MTAIIMIAAASLLVTALATVMMLYYLVKFRREFNENMQFQVGRYDCILAMSAELTRTQNDIRILLSNIEMHLRSITVNEPKESRYGPAGIERASV